MSSLVTLRNRLRDELKIDKNGRVWNDTILNRNIVQAVRQIQQDGNFDWYFNDAEYSVATTPSTGTYTLPTGFIRFELGTVKWNGYPLEKADYRWLKRNYQTLSADGNPSCYYRRGTNIGLFLRPNAAQTLEFLYRKQLTDMSADADDSGMPSTFDEAIVQYAAYLTWNDIMGRADKATESVQNYRLAMEGLYTQYLGRDDEGNFGFSFETTTNQNSIIY